MATVNSLSKLIKNLKITNDPFPLINAYKGDDWEKYISCGTLPLNAS